MPLNWSDTQRESAGHGVKTLVYGNAGVGKTRLCGTAPSPLIISAEAGLLTLRSFQAIPVLVVKNIQDVHDALAWCKTDAIKSGIQTVCLDSISEITEVCLTDQKKKTKDPRAAYGDMATQIIELVKAFRNLPGLHVLITAKEVTVTDPITGVAKAQPTAPGQQVGPALPYLFDEVFHAATDKDAQGATFHYLRTHSAHNAIAKDRSGALDEVEFPDMTHLINKILTVPAPAQATA